VQVKTNITVTNITLNKTKLNYMYKSVAKI